MVRFAEFSRWTVRKYQQKTQLLDAEALRGCGTKGSTAAQSDATDSQSIPRMAATYSRFGRPLHQARQGETDMKHLWSARTGVVLALIILVAALGVSMTACGTDSTDGGASASASASGSGATDTALFGPLAGGEASGDIDQLTVGLPTGEPGAINPWTAAFFGVNAGLIDLNLCDLLVRTAPDGTHHPGARQQVGVRRRHDARVHAARGRQVLGRQASDLRRRRLQSQDDERPEHVPGLALRLRQVDHRRRPLRRHGEVHAAGRALLPGTCHLRQPASSRRRGRRRWAWTRSAPPRSA